MKKRIKKTTGNKIRKNNNLKSGANHYSKRFKASNDSLMPTQPYHRLKDKLKCYSERLEKEFIKQEVAKNEIKLARKIQEDSLPRINSSFNTDKFSAYAKLKAAKEVSGDFYDIFYISKNIVVFLTADVSGKGFPAAFYMAIAKTTIKNICQTGFNVALDLLYGFNRTSEILYLVNNTLAANNMSNMFVTVFLGLYDINTGRLCYSNAGHLPPIKINHKTGHLEEVPSFENPVLGIIEDIEFKQGETLLEPDETLMVYTDGIVEAVNNNLEEYGCKRLIDFLRENKNLSNKDLTDALINDVEKFQDYKLFDDATVLTITRNN